MGPIGLTELIVILVIVLLLFGARRLPDLASGLGGAVHQFKKALRGAADEDAKTITARTEDPVPSSTKTSETASKT